MFRLFQILSLVFIANNAMAISATTPSKISNGVATERIQAYAATSTKAQTVGIVEPGTNLIEYTTFMKTNPGLAIMEDNSWDRSVPFDRGSHVHIWEYLGDGYSKVIINDVRYITKVARSKTECNRFGASPRYCWVKVIEEPEYYEWKQVALNEKGEKFWILNRIVDGSGIIVVKDQGIEKTRIVKTEYVEEPEKLEVTEEVKENNALLLDEDLKTEKTKEGSLEANVAKNLALSKEERAKARAEAKAKLKAMNSDKPKNTIKKPELTQEQMFKQQNIKSLELNVDEKSTTNTLKQVNKEFDSPATKLKLEKNKPLTLPIE